MFYPYEKKEHMCIAGVSQSKKKVIVSLTIIRKPHKHCAHMFSNNVQIKDKKTPMHIQCMGAVGYGYG
jgi:hypothetical protein